MKDFHILPFITADICRNADISRKLAFLRDKYVFNSAKFQYFQKLVLSDRLKRVFYLVQSRGSGSSRMVSGSYMQKKMGLARFTFDIWIVQNMHFILCDFAIFSKSCPDRTHQSHIQKKYQAKSTIFFRIQLLVSRVVHNVKRRLLI